MATYGIETLVKPPNEEQSKNIKKFLKMDEDRFEHNLGLLEVWMEKHPFIPEKYEKNMLRSYLSYCKQDMEVTKKKIQSYFICMKKFPEFFKYPAFSADEMRTVNNFYLMPASDLTPEGYLVTYLGFRRNDPDGQDLEVIHKIIWAFSIYKALRSNENSGNILIMNSHFVSPLFAAKLINPMIKRALTLSQSIFPFRMNEIFIINAPNYVETTVNIFKKLLTAKLRERIHIHSGDNALKQHLPDHCIPTDFGGTATGITEQWNNWIELMETQKIWWKEQEQSQVGMIPKDLDSFFGDSFGTTGSFRQLDID